MKRIPLRARDGSVRAYALVDDTDFEWLSQWRWCLNRSREPRAERREGGKLVRMHRKIMGLTHGDGLEVDHKDGNTLNNQRDNLRVVTHAQNLQNRQNGYRGKRTSRHRGVCWDKGRGKWNAKVQLNGRHYNLGRYDDEEEAARVVVAWRREHMPYSIEAA